MGPLPLAHESPIANALRTIHIHMHRGRAGREESMIIATAPGESRPKSRSKDKGNVAPSPEGFHLRESTSSPPGVTAL